MSALTKSMTEDELLTAITEAATYLGWRWHHVRRSDKAIQQGHSGFPDLVLARAGDVRFLELKSESGHVTPDQAAWITALRGDCWAKIIRPAELDFILEWLK
jgi:hypothetical protein